MVLHRHFQYLSSTIPHHERSIEVLRSPGRAVTFGTSCISVRSSHRSHVTSELLAHVRANKGSGSINGRSTHENLNGNTWPEAQQVGNFCSFQGILPLKPGRAYPVCACVPVPSFLPPKQVSGQLPVWLQHAGCAAGVVQVRGTSIVLRVSGFGACTCWHGVRSGRE